MRLIGVIEELAVIQRILAHLGLPTRARPRGRPWRRQQVLPDQAGTCVYTGDGVDPPGFSE